MLFESRKQNEKMVISHHEAQSKLYTWHAHDYREVLNLLGSSDVGLSFDEVSSRRKKFGENKLTELPEPGLINRIVSELRSPLPLVLVFAALLTIALQKYVDAGVIFFALSIAITVGILQEGRASKAFRKLERSQAHMAVVLRGGGKHEVKAEELVPGDVVELQSGMQVPADLRLIATKKFSVNEAALTGEWQSVEKTSAVVPVGSSLVERSNMAWLGTFAVEGHSLGVVVTTGDATVVGGLSRELQLIPDANTPLQQEMKKLSRVMMFVILLLVVAVFAIGLINGQPFNDMLIMAIAVAVASVPEGLPAAVTIILAVGMEALLRRGGLVRNLLASETLGSTTYVLTDKTGTLTEAKMVLSGIIRYDTANLDPSAWKESMQMRQVLELSLYASDAFLDDREGSEVMRGDPLEQAILKASLEAGVVENHLDPYKNRLDYLAFDSDNRYAAGLFSKREENRLCINGAPEYLLVAASKVLINGEEKTLTASAREHFLTVMREHTKEGKRLIAVAYKDVKAAEIGDSEEALKRLPNGSVFVGLLIFNDPVRPGVRQAIKGVKEAGAEVILVTGDNADTALSIAKAVGIAGTSENALIGNDLDEMTDEEALIALETVHVFARVLPHQKLRLAELLQSRGEIVAMTGDGINDTLALKRANIGIAIGSGSEVAKESSDLVLLDDSFAVIYAAIEEGRRIVTNLRKVVAYLISTSLSEVILIATALLSGAAVPILPVQILWANVIEEGFMSVAFAFEPGEKGAMKRKPQDIYEEGILSSAMLWFLGFVVSVLGFLIIALYFYFRSLNVPLEELRSVMFLAVSIDSLFMAFAFRSLTTPLWRASLRTNLFFVGSFLVSGAALLLALSVPFMRTILSYTPLPLSDVLIVIAFSAASLLTVELGKYLFFSDSERA